MANMAICDNPRCPNHQPLPSGLPANIDWVRVEVKQSLNLEPFDARGATCRATTRIVLRHHYRDGPGLRDYYLCDDCHEARQKDGTDNRP